MNTQPFWLDTPGGGSEAFPSLGADLSADVLVIGGGITGITAAFLLAREGKSVVLVERETIGARDTGHTTAHLTYMTDTRLSDLVATFSRREAQLAWQAGAAAMDLIRENVDSLGIDCALKRVPGYLVAAASGDVGEERAVLQAESEMAHQFGFDVRFEDGGPVTGRPCIRFAGQMEFHPLKYLRAMAAAAVKAGARIFENCEVTAFEEDPLLVHAGGHVIRYKQVVIATHVPLQGMAGTLGAALFQTKLALYSTYAVAARIPAELPVPDMIWSDTADPFLYLRIGGTGEERMAILGGEDHKTGVVVETGELYQRLEQLLLCMIPQAEITHRWSGQVVETVDGLPFIGPTSEAQFIATGFSGDGMTFGTTAAMMARDWVLGRRNPWADLFNPGRRSLSSFKEYVKENSGFPLRMVRDRLKVREGDPEDLGRGEARVMEFDCKRVAAHRDEDGKLHVCSAVCPHLGCIVAWNEAESTWDCPCHGSRFTAGGKVIAGPAETDLEAVEMEETANH
ncbi:FAD-dependent oxidoreductase [Luteolibacter sp. Populi]|uniref:FAD-dependent oxidoreductase n=1 Tax=Luteolibacter sp. Populi TaxID=3230487 RepID=UPI0034650B82